MIINASVRTDIPAYFSDWFFHRLEEGYVYVRNPYYPTQVTKYILNPEVVDSIVFCTKNPRPILSRLDKLKDFHPYFFITITPYDYYIEPNVPPYQQVIDDFKKISLKLGTHNVALRYDPIFMNSTYTIEKHIQIFDEITKELEGYTDVCIISFIDLYAKTKKNFPNVKAVSSQQQIAIAKAFSLIARKRHIHIKTCAEDIDLTQYGITHEGCITKQVLSEVIGCPLIDKKSPPLRKACHCFPTRDIGEYNTCMHGCLYCYANEDKQLVIDKFKRHDPYSPFLIGHQHVDDVIKLAKQESYKERQLSLDL